MKNLRKISIITGILFIIGTAAGILSGVVVQPLQAAADSRQAIAAHETQWIAGSLLVLVMGAALAIMPVVLFPLLRKQNRLLAIGAILFRGVLEAIAYILMAVSMLLLLPAGQALAARAGSPSAWQSALGLLSSSTAWVEILLAIVFSIGSLIINLLFFQMKAVPRWLSGWGFVGSLLYFAAALASLFSASRLAISFDSPLGILIAPLAIQEMMLAGWLIIRGFNRMQIATA